ncbi:Peroxisomal coenzyme A diphosphatase nudt7 [Gaertneriomyces sp. JEL0708]|nr:Peroxisomal coenzyme A diphosphatase nudt7 [Gaertneriomyces sp. JEL0708]
MRPEVQRLMNYTPPVDVYGRDRRAAVLIPLIVNPRSDELEVLLTVRSANLRRHSGEVALPGGRHETEDHDLLTTALREAQEEIGLPPQDVKSVTALPPFLSRFHLLVTPVVGTIPSTFTPKPNPDEVAACFTVPLRRFLLRQAHASLDITTEGVRWRKHRFWWNPLDPDIGKQESGVGYDIWGLTADILIRVALLAYDTPPEFEVDAPGQRDREEIIHGLNAKGRFGPRM